MSFKKILEIFVSLAGDTNLGSKSDSKKVYGKWHKW